MPFRQFAFVPKSYETRVEIRQSNALQEAKLLAEVSCQQAFNVSGSAIRTLRNRVGFSLDRAGQRAPNYFNRLPDLLPELDTNLLLEHRNRTIKWSPFQHHHAKFEPVVFVSRFIESTSFSVHRWTAGNAATQNPLFSLCGHSTLSKFNSFKSYNQLIPRLIRAIAECSFGSSSIDEKGASPRNRSIKFGDKKIRVLFAQIQIFETKVSFKRAKELGWTGLSSFGRQTISKSFAQKKIKSIC